MDPALANAALLTLALILFLYSLAALYIDYLKRLKDEGKDDE